MSSRESEHENSGPPPPGYDTVVGGSGPLGSNYVHNGSRSRLTGKVHVGSEDGVVR